ncbi:MAG: glycosyltransferase [Methylococcus sp.]
MPTATFTKSLLNQGNNALRAREYVKAIQHYLRLLATSPVLGRKLAIIDNLVLARRRYRRERANSPPWLVAVCGSAFMSASAKRIDLLTELYHSVTQVEILTISLLNSDSQRRLDCRRDIPVQVLSIEDERGFIEHAMTFVLAHPYDVIHLAAPGMPELITGLLYKLVWGASVLVHFDDADLAYMQTNTPLTVYDMMQSEVPLDSLTDSSSTRLAMSLARAFDKITLANQQLQASYGGITIQPISQEAQTACLECPSRPLAPELQRLCVSPLLGSLIRLLPWAPTANRNGVSIIILTLNGASMLDRLLKSFFRTNTHQPVELIVVDHGSVSDPADHTPSVIAHYQGLGELCHIQRGANYSFSASCNLAAKWARYPNLLFLNNDIIYSTDALPSALQKLEEPGMGIVGIRLDDDSASLAPGQEPGIQHLGIEFNWNERRGYHHPRQIRQSSLKGFLPMMPSDGSLQPAVTGAFLLCRKSDFEALGGFSDAYDYGLEDIDLCLRMNRDLDKKCWCMTGFGLQHAESSTRKRDKSLTQERIERNHQQFKKVWAHHTAQLARATDPPRLTSVNTSNTGTKLNVLFVLPQALDSNSGYHVQLHAARLMEQGVDCVVTVPDSHLDETTGDLRTCSYSRALASHSELFRDSRAPDVIHAWTPREIVRRFVEKFRESVNCRLVIHLEDNEEYLTEVALNQSFAELAKLSLEELDNRVPAHRYHPVHGRRFLEQADGLTLIIETLQRFNFRGLPSLILPPPVDERLFYPRPLNRDLRQMHGIPDNHCVLAYTGNVHQANKHEVAELYRAVECLNQQGHPTHLLRTGLNGRNTSDILKPSRHVHELGWVQRELVPEVLAAADILVQPGDSGKFNDQRVPSKLPEYVAMGRPVILSRSQIRLQSESQYDAFLVDSTISKHLVEAVMTIRQDDLLAVKLAQGARQFYEKSLRVFDDNLFKFYGGGFNLFSTYS